MHNLQIPAIIDFTNKKCKNNQHTGCEGTWFGLGFKVNCSCFCHSDQYPETKGRELDDVLSSIPIELNDQRYKHNSVPIQIFKKPVDSKNNSNLSIEGSEALIDRYSLKENSNNAR